MPGRRTEFEEPDWFKKWIRDLDSDEWRIDRAHIAAANLAKSASRQGRGVLGGSGDSR